MTAKDHASYSEASNIDPEDLKNIKLPKPVKGKLEFQSTPPSTQIREKIAIEFARIVPNQVIRERNKEYWQAVDAILNLFKAELNQLIEDLPDYKKKNELPEVTSVDAIGEIGKAVGFNECLDLAKQVIVKRIEGI